MLKKKLAKAVTSVLLFAVLLLNCMVIAMPTADAAIVKSGKCGENAVWTLDSNGTFTVSGTGPMDDYEGNASAPWYSYDSPIKRVVIKDGITHISDNAFYHCFNLKNVSIADSVTSIGNGAFAHCAFELKEIVIPKGVTSIGSSAFASCEALEKINMPDGLESIGSNAFQSCDNLKEIVLPKSLKELSNYMFKDCTALESVAIGESVTIIGSNAFENCTALKELTIPQSVTTMGSDIFTKCTALERVVFENDYFVPHYDMMIRRDCTIVGYEDSTIQAYAEKYKLAFESLGAAPVRTIATGSCGENLTWTLNNYGLLTISGTGDMVDFPSYGPDWRLHEKYAKGILQVVVEEGVTGIGEYAFSLSQYTLQTIELPTTIKRIGKNSFSRCHNVEKIVIYDPACVIDDSTSSTLGVKVIYGYTDSTAHEYAKKWNKDFFALDADLIVGDADLDGVVTATDARLVLRNAVGLETLKAMQLHAADADENGVITASDARLVLRKSAGLED